MSSFIYKNIIATAKEVGVLPQEASPRDGDQSGLLRRRQGKLQLTDLLSFISSSRDIQTKTGHPLHGQKSPPNHLCRNVFYLIYDKSIVNYRMI